MGGLGFATPQPVPILDSRMLTTATEELSRAIPLSRTIVEPSPAIYLRKLPSNERKSVADFKGLLIALCVDCQWRYKNKKAGADAFTYSLADRFYQLIELLSGMRRREEERRATDEEPFEGQTREFG